MSSFDFIEKTGLQHLIGKIREQLGLKADKTELHSHTNKPILDKFSEVDGKPFYGGDEIGGGTLENYTEKTTTTTGAINLNLGNVFIDAPTANRTYSITNAKSGVAHSFTLQINMGTVRTLTFPASVKWQGGEIPDMTTASKNYVLTFMTTNGGSNWLGMFGGEF